MSHWMLQVCLILVVSIMLGRLAEKFGQSRVIGEIAAGLLLGSSVLGALFPAVSGFLFTADSLSNLKVLAELGLVLLMFEIAWHAPVGHSAKRPMSKLAPITIALFGMLASFIIGCAIAIVSKAAMAPDKGFWSYILFCGLALSVTALPVLVRIIADTRNIEAESASYALSSAIYTDIFAWLGVALLVAFHSMSETDVLQSLIKTLALLGFFIISFYMVRPLLLRFRFGSGPGSTHIKITLAFCYCLISSEITGRLGFHQAIGAIVAAYVFCKMPGLEQQWGNTVGKFSSLFLTPLFFAYSGLQASFGAFSQGSIWGWLAVFILGAFIGKIGGSYLGGRLGGLKPSTAMEVGVLMNTKGLVELVVLSVGLQLDILSVTTYSVLLVLALFSTVMTTPLLNLWVQYSTRSTSGIYKSTA
ncbi:cation:proton antiporter [Pseudomonas moorei]|uniref:cation:proton antiporter domain-containing protein n=1 Tax=Pseudomonas moorei TaxID=395599 RepID=UPI00200C5391|nr:cation:proton antiporter [Pseudomonas moorei]